MFFHLENCNIEGLLQVVFHFQVMVLPVVTIWAEFLQKQVICCSGDLQQCHCRVPTAWKLD